MSILYIYTLQNATILFLKLVLKNNTFRGS